MPDRRLPKPLLAAALAAVMAVQGCSVAPRLVAVDDGLPRGSYRDSCRDARLADERRLVAECRNDAGEYFQTTLALPCFGRVENRDGWLVCDDDGGRLTVPDGPYRTQCRDEQVTDNDTMLVAECRDNRNRWVATKLALPCRDVIRVENGRLACGFIGPAPGVSVPRGTYRETCTEARIALDDILVANCTDDAGRVFETRLRLPCAGDVANANGNLVCRP